ncbi:MAG: sigma-54 dependent transcriptional regulator [Bacteroidota bacterium]
MEKILIIDDEQLYRTMLKHTLVKEGYTTIEAESGESGLALVASEHPDLVLTDFRMPGMDGLEVLSEIHKTDPRLPVVLFTAFGDVALTIRSIQVGAFDFLEKPFNPLQLKITVHNALNSVRLSNSLNEVLTNGVSGETMLEDNIPMGKTLQMKEIFKNIGRISLNKVNVLIQGETGTGKELIARLIHFSGVTRQSPFVILNCSTLSESILESELFGQVKESFTGTFIEKKGKLEQAGDGTIFLSEISDISLNTQVKLLRVIQDLEFEKVDGQETIPLKACIIASTTRDLETLVKEGKFREDLYYRLKVFTISLPALRERKEDMRDLVIHFLHKLNKRMNKNVIKIGDGVIELLQAHEWFGNLRELENAILQAIVMSKSDVLEKDNITLNKLQTSHAEPDNLPQLRSLSDVEKYHIERILNEVKWNKVEASRILEITRPTLNAKIEKYGLVRN